MLDKSYRQSVIPRYFYNRITDITPEELKSIGVKGVAVDLDNTTVYDSTYKLFAGSREWIEKIRAAGIPVMVISNTYMHRAKVLAHKLGDIPYIGNSGKPGAKCYNEGAKILNIKTNELAMIGDQLFTDICGANDAGAISIRVKYRMPEIIAGIRYRYIRHKENSYLKKAGYEDKI